MIHSEKKLHVPLAMQVAKEIVLEVIQEETHKVWLGVQSLILKI